MRIVFTIAYLGAGGAQRVAETVLNELAKRGHQITIVSLAEATDFQMIKLDPSIQVELVGRSASLLGSLTLVKKMRSTLRRIKPDVILAFGDQTNILTLISSFGLGFPVVVSERVHPAYHTIVRATSSPFLRFLVSHIRNLVYLFAHRIVVQTESGKDFFPRILRQKVEIIPNPVPVPPDEHSRTVVLPKNCILTIGRLNPQKRHDLLIEAFSEVVERYPDWRLCIYGEGPLKTQLMELIARLKLEASVTLAGRTDSPGQVLRQAEIFVLTSDFEGFPNALCEAMACGCAVISTDCPSGPSSIVSDELDGLLIPVGDRAALVDALSRLIQGPELRRLLGEQAKRISERLAVSVIVDRWERILSFPDP